jgi:uncharacterized protein (TIGR00369 family)
VTTAPVPADPRFRERVRESFARQRIMATLGATLERVDLGEVEIALPYRIELTQQQEFLHAGVLATILDSACGYASFTLMPADSEVVSVEFKLNLLAPAVGERLLAGARVVRAGRTITVAAADGIMQGPNGPVLVATMTGTMMCVRPR